jgi:hypothetical protein
MTSANILPPGSALFQTLRQAALERRCVFFAGLPGVGKSLLLQQLALLALEYGRSVSLLQWDVARSPFETPDLLARFPETDGVTHPVIRKAVGVWARGAVAAWHQQHPDPGAILIGEVPLIGNRLIELVQRQPDDAEPLLAGDGTRFLIPVPSRAVRQVIEAARVREMVAPNHERERANAIPSLVQALWQEIAAVAVALGISPAGRTETAETGADLGAGSEHSVESFAAHQSSEAFDPALYAAVYQALLRHRRAALLHVSAALPVPASVYDALEAARDLVPGPDAVARSMAVVVARPEAEIAQDVADWFRVT